MVAQKPQKVSLATDMHLLDGGGWLLVSAICLQLSVVMTQANKWLCAVIIIFVQLCRPASSNSGNTTTPFSQCPLSNK